MRRVFALILSITGLCASSTALAERGDIRKEAAALRGRWNSVFHEKARDADSLRVTYGWYRAEGQVVQVFQSQEAIKGLLDAIEVVEDHNGASVGCFGPYRYEFIGNGEVIADISEACSALFWRGGTWVGTPLMTERGQKALVAWARRYFTAR